MFKKKTVSVVPTSSSKGATPGTSLPQQQAQRGSAPHPNDRALTSPQSHEPKTSHTQLSTQLSTQQHPVKPSRSQKGPGHEPASSSLVSPPNRSNGHSLPVQKQGWMSTDDQDIIQATNRGRSLRSTTLSEKASAPRHLSPEKHQDIVRWSQVLFCLPLSYFHSPFFSSFFS